MSDGDTENKNQIIREKVENRNIQRYDSFSGTILQSFWIRCRSIFPYITNGKFMESELRYVLYCGIVFWITYLLAKAFL